MYSHAIWLERIQRAVLRGLAVLLAAVAAVWIRHVPFRQPEDQVFPLSIYAIPVFVAALVHIAVLWKIRVSLPLSSATGWQGVVRGVSVATGVLLAASFFVRGESYSRATVLIFFPLAIVAVLAADATHVAGRRALYANRAAVRRALIVGSGAAAVRIARRLLADPAYYQLVGFLTDLPEAVPPQVPVLGRRTDLHRVVGELGVDEVILAEPDLSPDRVIDLVGECMRVGVEWKVIPFSYDMLWDRVRVDVVDGMPLIGARGPQLVGVNWALKRSLDFVAASAFLLLFSPIMLAVAVAVKLSSPGPVIYRQTRVGLNGREFMLYKFRSMRVDSDSSVHQDFATKWITGRTGVDGEVHKKLSDPRITAVGRLIRKTSLDELPQLWNVLVGDMSLVGPRPPIPYEVARYTEWHRRRLSVPPGVTGLWQVSGRNQLSFDQMIDLDIQYIEGWTLRSDLGILLKTVPAVIRGH